MAGSATGPPTTNFGLPTISTGADAPDGIGINNIVTAIDTSMALAVPKSAGTTAGDLVYWTGASTPVRLGIGGTSSVLSVSGGIPSWGTIVDVNVNSAAAIARTKLARNYTLLHNAGTFSVPFNTFQSITFDTEDFDDEGIHSLVTNTSRITITTSGMYVIGGFISWTNSGGNDRLTSILVNGARILFSLTQNTTGSGFTGSPISVPWYLNAGDFVELEGYHNQASGLALNAIGGISGTKLWAARL